VEADAKTWRALCGKAVALCGSQQQFQQQARILKRLVQAYGPDEVERMIAGAQRLGWRDLKSLGSKEGLGRRWALEAFWQSEKRAPAKTLNALGDILQARGLVK